MAERYNEELRNARIARGLELKEVARVTRISIRVLEAIERDNLEILPPAYVRAFLRDYATYLGVDPAEIISLYEGESPKAESYTAPPLAPPSVTIRRTPGPSTLSTSQEFSDQPEEPAASTKIQPMKPPRIKRVDTNLTAVIAIGIVLLTGFVLIYFFLSGDANDKKVNIVTSQTPPPPIVPQYTPATPPEPKRDSASRANAAAYPAGVLTLETTAADSVWISVVADTAHVQRGMVAKGTHLKWQAKEKFLLTVGNTRLATFMLNGRKLLVNDSTSRVLRNVVVNASTTMLNPGAMQPAAPQRPVEKSIQKKYSQPSPTKSPASPATKQPAKPAAKPSQQPPAKQSSQPQQKKSPAAPPSKKSPKKKQIQLKPFPDTIEKVKIK